MLGLLGYQFSIGNPERAELDKEINALDMQLVQLKAIRRDQARYRAEQGRLSEQLREGHRFFAEDLEVLSSRLAQSGISLAAKRSEAQASPPPRRYFETTPLSLTLKGSGRDSVFAAFAALDPMICSLTRFELEPSGAWTMGLDTQAFVQPSPDVIPARPPPRWYSSLNEDQRQTIAAKQAELDALRAELGDEKDFGKKKRELEALSRVIETLAAARDGHAELLQRLFLGDPILTSGTVSPAEAGFKVQGLLAKNVDPASVPGRIAPEWKAVTIAFHDRQLDLVAARVPKAPKTP
jgi:hypothetical protein